MRTCIGCRTTRPQAELVRCAAGPDGHPLVSRTAPGRGAWLCSTACWDAARRGRRFERAWRRPLDAGDLDALRIAFESTLENMRHLPAVGSRPATSAPTKG